MPMGYAAVVRPGSGMDTIGVGFTALRLIPRLDPAIGTGIEDKGPYILGIIISMTVICTLLTAGRLFVRGHLQRQLQADDYVILVSVVCAWLLTAFTVLNVGAGSGRHVDRLSDAQQRAVLHWTVVGFTPGILSFALPKLAVVSLLTRIMRPSKSHAIFLWAMAVLCLMQLLVCIVTLFIMCDPAEASAEARVCVRRHTKIQIDVYVGSFSAAVDLYLAVYPATVLFRLQLCLLKKAGLSVALGIGLVSAVVAAYKCTRLPSLESADFTFDSADLVIWTSIEGNTIIMAACIPLLKPLYDYLRNGFRLPPSSALYHNYVYAGSSSGRGNRARTHARAHAHAFAGPHPHPHPHSHPLPSFLKKTLTRDGSREDVLTITGPRRVKTDGSLERPDVPRRRSDKDEDSSSPMRPRTPKAAHMPPPRRGSSTSQILVTDHITITYQGRGRFDLAN